MLLRLLNYNFRYINNMERLIKFKKSGTYACLNLSKSLFNNITTFLALFSSIGLISSDTETVINVMNVMNVTNVTNVSNTNSTLIDNNDNSNYFSYMLIGCTFFGLVRIINDFTNLCQYGTKVPNSASKGDYIGVFGEDLGVLCVEVMKRNSAFQLSFFDMLSGICSAVNYCMVAVVLMGKIILEGLKSSDIDSAMCLIRFLAFVGASGFYVLYKWITVTSGDVAIVGVLYFLYMGISLFHTWIYISILREKE
jgi:hypothetical protein